MYQDPTNLDELLTELHSLPTLKEVREFIDRVYPTWLISMISEYSNDYAYMDNNWKKLCADINVNPKEIIIVDSYTLDSDHTLIKQLCELLTRSGFVVRTKNALMPCSDCGKAIATESLYNILKENKMPVPDTWSSKCSGRC
jgi:hypothetical protein